MWARRAGALLVSIVGACSNDLASSPGDAGPGPTVLSVYISDETGAYMPGKVFLYDAQGTELHFGGIDYNDQTQDLGVCDLGPGATATWEGILLRDGTADLRIGENSAGCAQSPPIPFGSYHVKVMRGIVYEPYEADVVLEPNRGRIVVQATLPLSFDRGPSLA